MLQLNCYNDTHRVTPSSLHRWFVSTLNACRNLALAALLLASLMHPAYSAAPTISISIGATTLHRGVAATMQATASGGTAPYTYTITKGALPPGLTIDFNNGQITGTPTAATSYSFTITATDSDKVEGSSLFAGNVGAGAPIATPQNTTFTYGTSGMTIIAALSGGTATSLTLMSPTAHGTIITRDLSSFSYTPMSDYIGFDSFTYKASNSVGSSSVVTVSINITPRILVITPSKGWSTIVGSTYTQTLTWSGGLAPYTGLSVTGLPTGLSVTNSTSDSVTISGIPTVSGDFTVQTHATDSSTPTSFQKSQNFTLTVTPAIPVAVADTASTNANQPVSIPVTTNDTGTINRIAIATAPTHGSAVIDGLLVIYTPAPNYAGSDSFTYTATGPGGTSAAATVTININNTGPTVVNQNGSGNAASTVQVDLMAGTTGGPFTSAAVGAVTPSTAGSAVIVDAGSAGNPAYRLRFTASAAFAGVATIGYTLTSASGASASAVASITIAARNDIANDAQVNAIVAAQTETANRFATTQLNNFQRRLEGLHGAGWGRSSVNLGLTPTITKTGSADQWTAQTTDRLVDSPLQAGMRKVDWSMSRQPAQQSAQTAPVATLALASLPDLPSSTEERQQQLALWITGTVDFGHQNAGNQRQGFRFTTNGISLGADYRVNDQLTLGVGGGYSRDHSDIGDNGSKNIGQALMGMFYGSVRPTPNIFVDGMLGYGTLDFDSSRFIAADNSFANGQRNGQQVFVALSSGYEFKGDAWLLSPYGRVDLTTTTLDQYSETASGINALTYFKQRTQTRSGTLGLRTEARYESSKAIWVPRARVEYRHQFSGASDAGVSYADLNQMGPAYIIRSTNNLAYNWTAGVGLRVDMKNGVALMLDYNSSLGNNQGRAESVLFGVNVTW